MYLKGRVVNGYPPIVELRKCVHDNVRIFRQVPEAVSREDHRPLPSSFVKPREKFWVCAPKVISGGSGEPKNEPTMLCDRIKGGTWLVKQQQPNARAWSKDVHEGACTLSILVFIPQGRLLYRLTRRFFALVHR